MALTKEKILSLSSILADDIITAEEYMRLLLELDQQEQPLSEEETNKSSLTIDDIIENTASYFNITRQGIIGRDRKHEYAYPRQLAIFVSKQLLNPSIPELSDAFGGRDHSTIAHALYRISNEIQTNDSIQTDAAEIAKACCRHIPLDEIFNEAVLAN